MCITAALAISLAQTAAGLMGKAAASNAQDNAYQSNAMAANSAAVEKYAQEQLNMMQTSAKATEERNKLLRSKALAAGTAKASSQNEGMSNNLVQLDIERQRANQEGIVNTNQKNAAIQSSANMTAIKAEAESRINSVQKGSAPDLLSAVITGLGPAVLGEIAPVKYKDAAP